MAITMTSAAAERVRSFLTNRGKGVGLRVGVKTTGCSGLAYVLEFVDELNDDDQVFEQDDLKIIVDGKSLDEAAQIKNTDIAQELALPPVKIHCSILAEDAIKAAIADYKQRHGG